MAENINNGNIDDIVNKVKETLKSGDLSASISFEIVDGDESETVASFTFDEAVNENEDTVELKAEVVAEETEPQEELSADKEEVVTQEQEQTPISSGIFTTYVPRFTSVSENYRMRDNSAVEEVVTTAPEKPKDGSLDFLNLPADDPVDPTAELVEEDSLVDATVALSGNSYESDADDVSAVFKFDTDDDQIDSEETPAEEEESAVEEENFDFSDDTLSFEEANEAQEETVAAIQPDKEDSDATEATINEEELLELEEPIENKPYVMPDPVWKPEPKVQLPATRDQAAMAVESIDEVVSRKKRIEYTAFSEKDGFYDSFIDSIMSVKVRIFAVAFLAVMLLLMENAYLFGVDVFNVLNFDGIGGASALLTLPFISGVFLLTLPEVIFSLSAFLKKKIVPELFIVVSFGVLLIYYIVLIAFARGDDYWLLGFLFSVFALLSLISTYYKKKADFKAFKIVSANKEKRVVDKKLTRNLPAEHRALDGKVESYKSRTARVFRTAFVSDFSARSSMISENSSGNAVILFASLGISIISAVVGYFIPGGIVIAASIFATVYMISVPAFIVITHKIPFYQATSSAERELSAVVGEKSFFDYSGIDVITFDDTEIFGKEDVNLQRIKVFGRKENLPKALQQMASLFAVIGGPLAYIFENSADRRVSPADNVAVDTDGVIGAIDGVEIMAGSAEFMQRRGIAIPEDEGEGANSQTTRIMYAAEGGEIYAKFYIRYMLSEDFTMILPILLDDGINPLIYTRDPNINDDLFRSLTAGNDSIRVLKKQNLPSSEVRLYSRISLGMVSIGDKTNIINTILLAKKYTAFQTKLALSELPVMIGGAMLGLLVSLCAKPPISSLILSVWYIGCSLAVIFIGKRAFGKKKEKNKYKEDR